MILYNGLLYCLVSFAVGIGMGYIFSWNLLYIGGFFAVILLVVVGTIYYKKYQMTIIALVCLFLVMGIVRSIQDNAVAVSDICHFAGRNVVMYGTVAKVGKEFDEVSENLVSQYDIKTKYVRSSSNELLPVSGGVRLWLRQSPKRMLSLFPGDTIVVQGRVRLPHGYNNPGSIDWVGMLRRQGITALMTAKSNNACVTARGSKYGWKYLLYSWRKYVQQLMNLAMPSADTAILSGMIFGGYIGISPMVIKDFSTTGIVHILSVSGTHIALVAGCLFWFGRRLHLGELITAIGAAIAVCLYAVISGLTPPVVRSAIMGLMALAALAFGREKDAPLALFFSAFIMLFVEPSLLYDISFQLSFCSTTGLIFLYKKCLNLLSWLPEWLAGAFAVTLAAQLGVFPFIAWYFNSFSVSSFMANLVIVPIIEIVVIIGLLGIGISVISLTAGKVILVVGSLLIGLVTFLTAILAKVPGANIYIPSMNWLSGLVYYMLIAWMFSDVKFSGCFNRRYRLGLIILLIVFGGLYYSCRLQLLSVYFIDVGQGDAALVVTPHGRSVLIDTGGKAGESQFDVGERVVLPYLKHYGIRQLDYLILTHGHQDHAGGAAAIAQGLPVNNVLVAQEKFTVAMQELLRNDRITVIPMFKGQTILIDNVTFKVIHAGLSKDDKGGNELSCVIRAEYGQHSFIFTGDLDSNGENRLLDENIDKATVLKVGHHGSNTSTQQDFLAALSPDYAVISVGYNNRFGHPSSVVLQRLYNNHIKVFRTDVHGSILFQSNGREMNVQTYLSE